MKFQEMKQLSKEQLVDIIEDSKKEIYKLSIQASMEKKSATPHKFKMLRKKIAQAKTRITQNELQIV